MVPYQYERIVHASRDFITLIDREYRYVFVNESYAVELGRPATEIIGRTVSEVWGDAVFLSRLKTRLDRCFQGQTTSDVDRFRFGRSFKYIHVTYYPYQDGDAITHAMVFSHDISMIKSLESRLLDFEFKDPVTGLFNQRSFDIVLDMELEKARRAGDGAVRALLFISLRNLEGINTAFGHELGNLLLESTALRIRSLRGQEHPGPGGFSLQPPGDGHQRRLHHRRGGLSRRRRRP